MNHYHLALFALYSVALLHLHPAGTQSASGLVDGVVSYEDLMRDALFAQAGGSGMEPVELATDGFCNPFVHEVTLEYAGCVTTYPTISCAGRCFTEERPHFFYSR